MVAQVAAEAEFAEGAVVGAFDAAFETREGGEGFRAGRVFEEDVAEADCRAGVFIDVVHVIGGFRKPVFEDALFETADATKTPSGTDKLVDEGLLGGSLGVEFGESGFEELFEGGVFFGGKDEIGCGEAVGESVEADGSASFGGAGTGALLGVAAIGVDLFFGGHCFGPAGRARRFQGKRGVGRIWDGYGVCG